MAQGPAEQRIQKNKAPSCFEVLDACQDVIIAQDDQITDCLEKHKDLREALDECGETDVGGNFLGVDIPSVLLGTILSLIGALIL